MPYKDPEKRRAYNKAHKKRYYAENRERLLAEAKEWRQFHPENCRAAVRRWRAKDPEHANELNRASSKRSDKAKAAARQKRWRDSHPQESRDAVTNWRKSHPGVHKTHTAKRRALLANPPWTDKEELKDFYAACPPGMEVDHIIPLRGITKEGYPVCGLHVIWNLQYLPIYENRSKGNKVD